MFDDYEDYYFDDAIGGTEGGYSGDLSNYDYTPGLDDSYYGSDYVPWDNSEWQDIYGDWSSQLPGVEYLPGTDISHLLADNQLSPDINGLVSGPQELSTDLPGLSTQTNSLINQGLVQNPADAQVSEAVKQATLNGDWIDQQGGNVLYEGKLMPADQAEQLLNEKVYGGYRQYNFDDAIGGVEKGDSGTPSNYDSNFNDWSRRNGVAYYTGDDQGDDNYARVAAALGRGAAMPGSGNVRGPSSNPLNQRSATQNGPAQSSQNPNTSNLPKGALAAMGGANMLAQILAAMSNNGGSSPEDSRKFLSGPRTNWHGPRQYAARGGLIQMAEGGSVIEKLRRLFAMDQPTTTRVRGRTEENNPRDARDWIVPNEGMVPNTAREIMLRGQQLREMEREGYACGGNIPGGQSDVVPINGAPGEYMVDADVVSALGDGSTEAGAARLDQMREAVRKHKRSAPSNKIPPKAKSPLEYMKGVRRG